MRAPGDRTKKKTKNSASEEEILFDLASGKTTQEKREMLHAVDKKFSSDE